MTLTSHPHQLNLGFTLVEVLISMLIVAIGLGGAVKLQIACVQSAQQSIYLSAASALATEMSDRMMGNAALQANGAVNPYLTVDFQAGLNQIPAAAPCYLQHCTAHQMALSDLTEWLHTINAALPNVHAVICQDDDVWNNSKNNFAWDCHSGTAHSGVVIKIGWSDKNDAQQIASPRIVMPAYGYGE